MTFINFDSYEIHDYIRVYRKLLPDAKLLHSSLKKIEQLHGGKYIYSDWGKWYSFGSSASPRLNLGEHSVTTDSDFDEEFNLFRRLSEATNFAISNYVSTYSVQLPEDSFLTYPSLARYDNNVSTGNNITMQYHTDFVTGEWYWPGEKFLLTCTTYPNDDYVGGEVEFFIDGEYVTYKPRAGEIVVFPSGSPIFPGHEPYFHCVKIITEGSKYLIRNYLKYKFEGTPEWHENVKKYGEEEWLKIATERDRHHNLISFDQEGNPHISEVAAKIHNKRSTRVLEK